MTIPLWAFALPDGYLHLANFLVNAGANLFIQSAILIAVGLVLTRFLRRRGSAVQSVVLRGVLVALILSPILSLILSKMGLSIVSLPLPRAEWSATVEPGVIEEASAGLSEDISSRTTISGLTNALSEEAATGTSARVRSLPPLEAVASADVSRGFTPLAWAYFVFSGLWIAGASGLLGWLAICHIMMAKLRRRARSAPEECLRTCQSLANLLEVKCPKVVRSQEVKSPLLTGLFSPVIIFPDVEEVEETVASDAVFIHELAHLKRRDCLWNLIARTLSSLLFYQPLMRLLARKAEEVSDDVCDDYVIRHGCARKTYARQLTYLAQRFQPGLDEAAVGAGVVRFRSSLGRRVVRILDVSRRLATATPRRTVYLAAFAVLIGAVLAGTLGFLPMASAPKPIAAAEEQEKPAESETEAEKAAVIKDASDPSGWKATLPNGVTVELLGVSYNPSEDQPWWRPDGSPLAEAPYDKMGGGVFPDEQSRAYEFAIRVPGLREKDISIFLGGASATPRKVRKGLEDILASARMFAKTQELIDLRVGAAAGAWETLAASTGLGAHSSAGRGTADGEDYAVIFSEPLETSDKLAITVSHTLSTLKDFRIMLVDIQNKIHKGHRAQTGGAGRLTQATVYFDKMPLEEVKEFRFQTRPYQWVEFRNISLRPQPAVEVSPKPALEKSERPVESKPVSVAGRVVNEKGEAVKGAKVYSYVIVYYYDKDEIEKETVSGEDGSFSFKDLPRLKDRYARRSIIATAEGYAIGGIGLTRKPDLRNIKITLFPPGLISGKVTDKKGKPVQGAKVRAETIADDADWSKALIGIHLRERGADKFASAITDEEGNYAINNIPQGSQVRLSVSKQNYGGIYGGGPVGQEDINFTLAPAGIIEGKVTIPTTGEAVSGLMVLARPMEDFHSWGWAKTDARGNYKITNLQPGTYNLGIHFSEESPEWVGLGKSDVEVKEGGITSGISLQLTKGGIITGKVIDKDTEEPIKGVWLGWASLDRRPSTSGKALTGEDGTYELRAAPGRGHIILELPNGYLNPEEKEKFRVSLAYRQVEVKEEETLSGIDFSLVKAAKIRGRVVDEEENLMPRASIRSSIWTPDLAGIDRVTAKEDGTFQIGRLFPDIKVVLFGRSEDPPLTGRAEVTPQRDKVSEVTIVLRKGSTVRGRVVDEKGKPVPGAKVWASIHLFWPDRRSGVYHEAGRATTDTSGNYEIKGLIPGQEYYIRTTKEGHGERVSESFTPEKGKITIIKDLVLLLADSFIAGRVTDSDTGKPIRQAMVQVMRLPDGGLSKYAHTDSEGKYRIMGLTKGRYRVYLPPSHPYESTRIETDSGREDVDFKLNKTKPEKEKSGAEAPAKKSAPATEKSERPVESKPVSVAGRVVDEKGEPLVGAEVILVEPLCTAEFRDGRFTGLVDSVKGTPQVGVSLKTDAQGRFSLPAHTAPYAVWVWHQRGYAEASAEDLSAARELTVAPWGRVEGELLVGKKPAPAQRINLQTAGSYDPGGRRTDKWVDEAMHVTHSHSTRTDDKGRFVFERVPAGKARLIRFFDHADGGWVAIRGLIYTVEAKSAQATRVTLGGEGRPVIGRVVQPAGTNLQIDWDRSRVRLMLPAPHIGFPGDEKLWAARGAFLRSEEGRHYFRDPVKVGGDRSFRIEGVPAGEYLFQVFAYEKEPGAKSRSKEPIARVSHRFTVPLMPGGRTDEQLNLGTLELKVHEPLSAGEAPATKAQPTKTKPEKAKSPADAVSVEGQVVNEKGEAVVRLVAVGNLKTGRTVDAKGTEIDAAAIGLKVPRPGELDNSLVVWLDIPGGDRKSIVGHWLAEPESGKTLGSGGSTRHDSYEAADGSTVYRATTKMKMPPASWWPLQLRARVATGNWELVGRPILVAAYQRLVSTHEMPYPLSPLEGIVVPGLNQAGDDVRLSLMVPKSAWRQWVFWARGQRKDGQMIEPTAWNSGTEVVPLLSFRFERTKLSELELIFVERRQCHEVALDIPKISDLTEIPDERSDEPLDIGTLELKVFQPAPLFETKTLDGEVLKLEDFRGKFVLLDFWAVWCGPCRGETPYLKATYEAFGEDERFVMIGLSLDKEVDAPKKYVEENDLKWIQGFLGEWSKTSVPDEYGVRGIPAIFLIGPDGKVIAKDLRGEAIKSAVERALRKPVE